MNKFTRRSALQAGLGLLAFLGIPATAFPKPVPVIPDILPPPLQKPQLVGYWIPVMRANRYAGCPLCGTEYRMQDIRDYTLLPVGPDQNVKITGSCHCGSGKLTLYDRIPLGDHMFEERLFSIDDLTRLIDPMTGAVSLLYTLPALYREAIQRGEHYLLTRAPLGMIRAALMNECFLFDHFMPVRPCYYR